MIGRGGRAVGALAVVAVLAGCGGADADNAAAHFALGLVVAVAIL
ncbi:hypothetical protein [Nocardia farcinica]|nr:hypothetical protein [Nocardia farcinica]